MPAIETNRAKIVRRLQSEGWRLDRHGAAHDVYQHPERDITVIVPRHREISIGTARSIARQAGWI